MVHGYPQQYSQSPLRRLVAQTMMMLRLACARVLPGWISAPVFYLVQQEHSLTYRQVLIVSLSSPYVHCICMAIFISN